MDVGQVSTRYARAFYEYALDKGMETQLYEEMKTFVDNYMAFPDFPEIMKDPTISSEEKRKVFITAAGISVSDVFKRVVDIILKNKRESFILFIALAYQTFYRQKKRIIIGHLTTAEPVSIDVSNKLKELVRQGSSVEVDFNIKTDPSIIGGFLLELDANLLDASLKNQLNRLRYQITK